MKTYCGMQQLRVPTVTVDGRPLSAKRYDEETNKDVTFDWGTTNEGAISLGLSLLSDALGDDTALALVNEFVQQVVSRLDADWELTSEDLEQWRDHICNLGYIAQSAEWTNYGSTPKEPLQIPLSAPAISMNPNYRRSAEIVKE